MKKKFTLLLCLLAVLIVYLIFLYNGYFTDKLISNHLSKLPIANMPTAPMPKTQERSVNDKYLLTLFGLQPKTYLFQMRNIKNTDGSYIVKTELDNVITYWEFNPNTDQFNTLYIANESGCNGEINGWDKANKKVFILMETPSVEDPSTSYISGACVYNYSTKKQIYKSNISRTKSNSYIRGQTTSDMSRIVIEGNNNILILDTTSIQNKKIIKGRTLYDSENTVEKYGIIILLDSQKEEYELSLYSVNTGELLKKISFNKSLDGKTIDYIHLNSETYNANNNLFYIEYVFYNPYTTCLFSFSQTEELKKVACSSDTPKNFYKE